MTKKVSIIIPAYNCSKYIEACVRSCTKQGLEEDEYEIIAVDDGSSDDTLARLKNLNIPALSIIHQTNKGVSSARNTGLGNASGEYVIFVDGDDILFDNSLSRMYELAHSCDADITKGKLIKLNDKEIESIDTSYSNSSDGKYWLYENDDILLKMLNAKEGWSVVNLFRRQFLISNNLEFPEGMTFMEDLAFTIKTYSKARKLIYMPIEFYIYRQNSTSCMANMNMSKLESAMKMLEVILDEHKLAKTERKKEKLTDAFFSSFSVIVWYATHYRSIFSNRSKLISNLSHIVRNVKYNNYKQMLLKYAMTFCPNLYLYIRYICSTKKYN